MAVHDDQRGPLMFGTERLERARGFGEVVCIGDGRDVPAVRGEARRDVLGEREIRMPLDGDAVRVVDPAEVREALVCGERSRLRCDAFHHAAVARLRIDVEVEEREPVPVVARAEPLARERHADGGGDALAEWARRRLHAARPAVLRMSRALRAELPKPLQIVERNGQLAEHLVVRVDGANPCEMKQRPEEGGGVPGREHEAVAVRPDRVGRVEAEEALPERVRNRRDPDGRPRMAGVRSLDRVDAERPDRRDARLVELAYADGGIGHADSSSMRSPPLTQRSWISSREWPFVSGT